MTLTKPDQDLKRNLQGIPSDLKWSAVELLRVAERLTWPAMRQHARPVLRMCKIFQADEDRLTAYVAEVAAQDCAGRGLSSRRGGNSQFN